MTFEIKDVAGSGRIYILIHGDPGVGKTSMIGQLGKKQKVLLIRSPIDHVDPIYGSGVKEIIVNDHEKLLEVLDYLRMEGSKWDWVWWDSITLTQDVLLSDVYQTMLDRKGTEGIEARRKRAEFGPDRGEYRVNMWRIEEFIRYAVGAGDFNFGIMSHSFWYTPDNALGDDEEPPRIWPLIQGRNLPIKISAAMNVVGFMEAKEVTRGAQKRTQRVIHFNKSERWYAKCQFRKPDGSDAFDDDLIAPTFEEIIETISSCRLQHPVQQNNFAVRRPTASTPARRTTKKR